jgi:OPT family oligopeptide transporter
VMTETECDALVALSDDPAYREAVLSLYANSQVPKPRYSNDIRPWLLWPGVTLMVVASLASLCFSWRSIFAIFSGRGRPGQEELAEPAESRAPRHWFLLGLGGVLVLSVVLQVRLFGIVWWAAIVAVLLAFGLAVVAARVTGETGISSVGAMGKVSQLVFGFLVPKNPVPNLMAANVAGGAASQCADLLDDLKCGHLLGASPRSQTFAQICGALAGALVGSAAYLLLIPEPGKMLLTNEWPAPAAAVWKAVAELLKDGFAALPPGTTTGMALAAVAAVLLTVLERVAPGKFRPFILSPVSIGLAFVIPAHFSLSIFAGGFLVLVLGLWLKDWSKRYVVAICVGLIAGESLTGIGLAIERALSS